MNINYDYIAFSGRLSDNRWTLGMKALQGEVPLDIVFPSLQSSIDPDDQDIIGVLTREGTSRESTDVMELYRYLRQLNPKSNQAFGFNEIVIRNIHSRLNLLKVDEELRVQISFSERKENYISSTYNIKLLGIFPITPPESSEPIDDIPEEPEIEIEKPDDNTQDMVEVENEDEDEDEDSTVIPTSFPPTDPDIPVYKTTNTLEKIIVFARTLQTELDEAKRTITSMSEKIQFLENDKVRHQELESLLQAIYDRLNHLENFDRRIGLLENDRHQLSHLRQTLAKYYKTTNRQTQALLNEVGVESEDPNIDS